MPAEAARNVEILQEPSPEDRRAKFESARFRLIQLARHNWENAVSYRSRPFKVGCAVLAWHPLDGWIEIGAYNYKPIKRVERGDAKKCAERMALRMAEANESTKIAAIVTVCDQQSVDTDQPLEHGVLHPCDECRALFRELDEKKLIDDNTILYNLHDPDLKTDPRANTPVSDSQLATIEPIPLHRHVYPRVDHNNFAVMGEERTVKDLLTLYEDKP